MSNDTNNLPPQQLPSPLNIPQNESERDRFFAQFDFDDTRPYEKPPYLFEINGVGFSPVGGIQALSGQKKNGKSIFGSLLIAAALCNGSESGRMAERFPGFRIRASTMATLDHERPVILYVDTEQEKENTSVVVERAKWLAEVPKYTHVQDLHTLWLREMPDGYDAAKLRWEVIKYKIGKLQPDLVIIDGIRDIVHNFNDLEESGILINELMNIASRNRCCIWCTLHMNPRPSNDDESKMRGHLGTELGNKVTDTFVMKKSKDKTTKSVKFTLSQMDARGEDVDQLDIILNHDGDDSIPNLGYPMLATANPTEENAEAPTDDVAVMQGWIDKARNIYDWPMTRKDFKEKVLNKIGHVKGRERLQRDLELCLSNMMLQETTIKSNGYYMIEPTDNNDPLS